MQDCAGQYILQLPHRGEARVSCLGGGAIAPGMANTGARAYNGGLGVEPPAGSRGRAPGQGVRGKVLKLSLIHI